MENNKLAVAISATKVGSTGVEFGPTLADWGKARIGRLFLRQSLNHPPTLLMDMKEPSFW